MPTTPRGYEYPSPTAAADGPYTIQRALESVDADVTAQLGAWKAYTPTLTASATSPSLGNAPVVQGRYCVTGKTVVGWFTVAFGTGAPAAGSGTYTVSLPVPRSTATHSGAAIGTVHLNDLSGGAATSRDLRVDGTMSRNGTVVTNASPWVWAAGDVLAGTFQYEAA